MNKTKFFLEVSQIGIVLTAVALLTVIGCGGNVDAPSQQSQGSSPGAVDSPSPAVAAQDDYVYYPSYGIYYSSGRRQYASLDGGAWISQPTPRGVSVDALHASPSVKMDFHDSPANHHAAVVQQYPTTWKPSATNQKGDARDGK